MKFLKLFSKKERTINSQSSLKMGKNTTSEKRKRIKKKITSLLLLLPFYRRWEKVFFICFRGASPHERWIRQTPGPVRDSGSPPGSTSQVKNPTSSVVIRIRTSITDPDPLKK
jgi:hypothetical protein